MLYINETPLEIRLEKRGNMNFMQIFGLETIMVPNLDKKGVLVKSGLYKNSFSNLSNAPTSYPYRQRPSSIICSSDGCSVKRIGRNKE